MTVCVLLVQVYGAVIFGFVDIEEELRSQILQHAIFQHLIMTYQIMKFTSKWNHSEFKWGSSFWSDKTREVSFNCEYGYDSSATVEIVTVKNYGVKLPLVVHKQ